MREIGVTAYAIARDAGWHRKKDILPQRDSRAMVDFALIHSEVSEAFEAYRRNRTRSWIEVDGKPEGVAIEFADVIIRIAEMAIWLGIDLDSAIECKMEYNRIRADVPSRSDTEKLS